MTQNKSAMLQSYLSQFRGVRIRPGRHDCALFAAGWVRLCTGVDHARGWRSTYRSLNRGRALLARAGYEDLSALANAHLARIPGWMQAQVGDLGLVIDADGEQAFGIVGGARLHVLSLRGVDAVSVSRAVEVFRP